MMRDMEGMDFVYRHMLGVSVSDSFVVSERQREARCVSRPDAFRPRHDPLQLQLSWIFCSQGW